MSFTPEAAAAFFAASAEAQIPSGFDQRALFSLIQPDPSADYRRRRSENTTRPGTGRTVTSSASSMFYDEDPETNPGSTDIDESERALIDNLADPTSAYDGFIRSIQAVLKEKKGTPEMAQALARLNPQLRFLQAQQQAQRGASGALSAMDSFTLASVMTVSGNQDPLGYGNMAMRDNHVPEQVLGAGAGVPYAQGVLSRQLLVSESKTLDPAKVLQQLQQSQAVMAGQSSAPSAQSPQMVAAMMARARATAQPTRATTSGVPPPKVASDPTAGTTMVASTGTTGTASKPAAPTPQRDVAAPGMLTPPTGKKIPSGIRPPAKEVAAAVGATTSGAAATTSKMAMPGPMPGPMGALQRSTMDLQRAAALNRQTADAILSAQRSVFAAQQQLRLLQQSTSVGSRMAMHRREEAVRLAGRSIEDAERTLHDLESRTGVTAEAVRMAMQQQAAPEEESYEQASEEFTSGSSDEDEAARSTRAFMDPRDHSQQWSSNVRYGGVFNGSAANTVISGPSMDTDATQMPRGALLKFADDASQQMLSSRGGVSMAQFLMLVERSGVAGIRSMSPLALIGFLKIFGEEARYGQDQMELLDRMGPLSADEASVLRLQVADALRKSRAHMGVMAQVGALSDSFVARQLGIQQLQQGPGAGAGAGAAPPSLMEMLAASGVWLK